jgi:hypothetical protein
MGRAVGDTLMNWTIERQMTPGLYWFTGTLNRISGKREISLATVVELTGIAPNIHVWFHRVDTPVPIRECEGQWWGPLDVPR